MSIVSSLSVRPSPRECPGFLVSMSDCVAEPRRSARRRATAYREACRVEDGEAMDAPPAWLPSEAALSCEDRKGVNSFMNPHLTWRLLAVGWLAVASTACDTPLGAQPVPDEIANPTAVGVISAREIGDDGRMLTLSTGEELLLPFDATELYGLAEEGKLIIFGTGGPAESESDTWYAVFTERGSDCYDMPANGEVRGDRLATSLGFSVSLSTRWSEPEDVFINSPPVGFCLDESGEATSAYPSSRSRN